MQCYSFFSYGKEDKDILDAHSFGLLYQKDVDSYTWSC